MSNKNHTEFVITNNMVIALFLLCAVSLPVNASAVVKKSRLNVTIELKNTFPIRH